MAIQMRRGNEADLDISQLKAGEIAVCLDTGKTIVKLSGENYLTLTDTPALKAIVDGKAEANHTHDGRYYTENEIDTKLSNKSNTSHTHDSRYYTESEIDAKLSGKAAAGHTHNASDITGLDAVADYYNSEDVYGVEVDYENNTVTRIAGATNLTAGADFDNLSPWARRRCILADDGVVLAYYGEDGYTETGSLTKAITKTVDGSDKTYAIGTPVQVMVEQNLFYIKAVPVSAEAAASGRGKQYRKARFYISPQPREGFMPMHGFRDANGVLQDKIYLAAYEACIYDTSAGSYLINDDDMMDESADKLSSIAGVKPCTRASLAQSRTMANNRSSGWQLHNIFALSVSQWLMLIEYASYDCQNTIGLGVVSTTEAVTTGDTTGLGNGSGIPAGGTSGKCSVSYRGEENLWGNTASFFDGINVYNNSFEGESAVYIKEFGSYTSDTSEGYHRIDFNLPSRDGCPSAFGIDQNYPELFLPTELQGANKDYLSAYYWYGNKGWVCASLGGQCEDRYRASAWALSSDHRYTDTRTGDYGSRLLYVPQSKVDDDGWRKIELTSAFKAYNNSDTNYPRYKVVGNVVSIRGGVSPTSTIASGGSATIGYIPSQYAPSRVGVTSKLCQGSGANTWVLGVSTSGSLVFQRYANGGSYTSASTSVWLPFEITYII